jgi:hypothetical protein
MRLRQLNGNPFGRNRAVSRTTLCAILIFCLTNARLMMQNIRNRQAFILICLLISLACSLSIIWKYPLLDTTTLYLPVDQFPSQIASANRPTNWQPFNQPFLSGEELDRGATISMASWIDQNEPAQQTIINQLVYNYSLQPPAMWSYFRHSGRPTPDTPSSDSVQSELPFGKRFANQEQLVCVNGDYLTCHTWCYWARYGQYVIRLYISNDQQKLDRSIIFQLIERLDQHVRQRVQSGSYR